MDRIYKKLDPNVIIDSIENLTSTDSFVQAMNLDVSNHPSFAIFIENTDENNTLSYKIETNFQESGWKEIKAETDILKGAIDIFEDESIGTNVRVLVKSKVSETPATFNVYARLKPGSYIV